MIVFIAYHPRCGLRSVVGASRAAAIAGFMRNNYGCAPHWIIRGTKPRRDMARGLRLLGWEGSKDDFLAEVRLGAM